MKIAIRTIAKKVQGEAVPPPPAQFFSLLICVSATTSTSWPFPDFGLFRWLRFQTISEK